MSQVISIRVPENYEEPCVAFKKEMDLLEINAFNEAVKRKFMVSYYNSSYEILCEEDFPDSFFAA